MKKALLIVLSAVVGIIVLAALGLWLFFNPDQFRPRLEAAMGGAVGRKVSLGHISLSLLSGSLAIDDVSIGDDPAFGTEPFVSAKRVSVGVDVMPLITSRSLHVDSFKLEQPRVTLLRAANGTWNFSNLAAGSSGGASKPAASAPSSNGGDVSIRLIAISDGQIRVGTTGARAGDKVRVYDHVTVEFHDVSQASKIPFTVAAKTPGGGSLDLRGDAGPLNQRDAAATPLHATVDLEKLDVASTGFVDPASGLAGVISFKGALDSDGRVVTSKGTVNASKMKFMPGGSPAAVPFEIDYDTDYTPETQHGALKQGDVHVGKAIAHLTGAFDVSGETPQVRLKLSGQQMAITELQAALPALGIVLPSGSTLKQGSAQTDLAITGPVDKLVISGPLSLSNAILAGFDLGGKMSAIAALGGLPKTSDTAIQTFSASVRVTPQGDQIDNINFVAPTIGTMTGSGTISEKGAMDFSMLVKLAATSGVGASVARVASLGQPSSGVPFKVQGTTSNPSFVPDVGRAVKSALTSDDTKKKAADVIGGFFRKKK
ncbi:MAG TPA: AsmA family protein [Vicinamibacterales bacterium]|nr:AsmA family protein [Vicinamibacterales bacterium]